MDGKKGGTRAIMISVYGVSDDLIEVEGDIREEFSNPEGKPGYFAFSDGTILAIFYSNEGTWRIQVLSTGPNSNVTVKPAEQRQIEEGPDVYSDRARIEFVGGPIKHVVFGTEYARAKS